jgi:hypothetical protein
MFGEIFRSLKKSSKVKKLTKEYLKSSRIYRLALLLIY